MSKSKGKKQDTTAYKNYSNYLKGVDTSNVDGTLKNFTTYAKDASGNLGERMGDYTFSADGSDAARQRAEQATYDSYMNYLRPRFEQQTSDLDSALLNKGLPVGSEAYERAMTDLQDSQNRAVNQAAYDSVLNGQNAFTQSLGDEIAAGNFGNSAQQSYINQLYSTLDGSPSAYENQQNIFGVDSAKSAIDYQNKLATAKGGWSGALSGAIKGGIQGGLVGGPWGAVAGAAGGAYSGYNNNPYAQTNGNGVNWSNWLSALQRSK